MPTASAISVFIAYSYNHDLRAVCPKLGHANEKSPNCDLFQLALPQLLPGTQFPYSFSTGQPIPGYYIPQPIAAAQSSYLQVKISLFQIIPYLSPSFSLFLSLSFYFCLTLAISFERSRRLLYSLNKSNERMYLIWNLYLCLCLCLRHCHYSPASLSLSFSLSLFFFFFFFFYYYKYFYSGSTWLSFRQLWCLLSTRVHWVSS